MQTELKYSIELLRAMISQNQLSIMRLTGTRDAENAIRVLQSQIDRWQQEIEARTSGGTRGENQNQREPD
jgi:hypothetical protein